MIIFLNIMVILCIFIMGTLFGSFFSLATYRIPKHEDITHTRSYCPSCHHKLGFFDLIPVISFLSCLGKCRYCKKKISPRYILLETCNGILFVLIFLILAYFTGNIMNAFIYSFCVFVVYAVVFVIIGSKIMAKKMKQENKKGVYIAELIIGFVMFLILISSTVVISRNYSKNLNDKKIHTDLVQATMQKLEQEKLEAYKTGYLSVTNKNGTYDFNGQAYSYKLEVVNYIDEANVRYDLIKTLKLTLIKSVYGAEIEYSLSDIIINYNLINR